MTHGVRRVIGKELLVRGRAVIPDSHRATGKHHLRSILRDGDVHRVHVVRFAVSRALE
jgi:hypothetical protein